MQFSKVVFFTVPGISEKRDTLEIFSNLQSRLNSERTGKRLVTGSWMLENTKNSICWLPAALKVNVKVAQSRLTLCKPMELSRAEYWSA